MYPKIRGLHKISCQLKQVIKDQIYIPDDFTYSASILNVNFSPPPPLLKSFLSFYFRISVIDSSLTCILQTYELPVFFTSIKGKKKGFVDK